MSKLQSMRARMRRISRYARLFFWGFPLLVLFFRTVGKMVEIKLLTFCQCNYGVLQRRVERLLYCQSQIHCRQASVQGRRHPDL